jgi:RNA recognition motif-containing protein
MASKLFVGGIPFSMTEDELNELFAAFGTVESAVIINDKFSGRSKGFGFVEMSSDDEARAAIKSLHDSEVGGRKITVNEARPQRDDRR